MIKYILLLSPIFCQAQVTLDTNQVKTANETYVYALHCKQIKDDLFIQLDSAVSLIEQQRTQIERYDTLSVIADAKYYLCEEDAANARKQAKKWERKNNINKSLLYCTTIISGIIISLYLLK